MGNPLFDILEVLIPKIDVVFAQLKSIRLKLCNDESGSEIYLLRLFFLLFFFEKNNKKSLKNVNLYLAMYF